MGTAGCATKDQDRADRTSLGEGREIEDAAGVYAKTKIDELAERKLRFDWPDLAKDWDKIQRRGRQVAIPVPIIESTQRLGWDFGRSLTLSRTADKE